ncbi:MAG: thioredoxin [Gemmatimonadetes bacterium]|nr:thioredoxin [Gemmatimonadota bacterium]MDA1102278.1 thioredoxin [Gemmatimonadota bacterium]
MFFKKREAAPPPPFVHAYDDDFDALVSGVSGIAVVDFWATWCRPCVMMEPILGEIAREFADRGVRVVKVDVDQAPETAEAFGIRSIPTLIFFRDGSPLFEMVGAVPKPVLERELVELLAE